MDLGLAQSEAFQNKRKTKLKPTRQKNIINHDFKMRTLFETVVVRFKKANFCHFVKIDKTVKVGMLPRLNY